jgi:hypothetical protein
LLGTAKRIYKSYWKMPNGYIPSGQFLKGDGKLLENTQMTQNLPDRCSFWLMFDEKSGK